MLGFDRLVSGELFLFGENLGEMGGRGVIIGEIFYLFLFLL